MTKNLTYLILLFSFLIGSAQTNDKISASFTETPLVDVLDDLSSKQSVKFFYDIRWLKDKEVSVSFTDKSLEEALLIILKDQKMLHLLREPNYVILLPDEGNSSEPVQVDNTVSNRVNIGKIDLSLDRATISGYVLDGTNSRPLESAIISIKDNPARYVTPPDGSFEISLPVGDYSLKFHHPTMVDYELEIGLNSNGELMVNMFEDVTLLEEVVIKTTAVDQNVSKIISGQDVLEIATIKSIPAFFGEADVISSVLALPGVSKVGEGSSGINVRGGGVGQNLIRLDNATVYNPSHLFGFFSTFNPDIVSRVNLYRGSIPVEYGGRLSSVMNVEIKNGNKEKVTGQGGAGLINSRIMVEGPIRKDSTSFLVAGRAAYPNYLLRELEDIELNSSRTFFGDANVKIDHLLNSKHRLSLNGYLSRDRFDFSDELQYNYGNRTLGLEWNGQLSERIFNQNTINYTSYDYIFKELEDPTQASTLDAEINQVVFDNKFLYESDQHKVTFGVNLTLMDIEPGNFEKGSELSIIEPLELDQEDGIEASVYVGDEFILNQRLSFYGGVRYSIFNGGPENAKELYHGAEPRFSVNYKTSLNSSIKLGYNRMRQYVHFISNTTAATPIDLWKLSNQSIRPQVADQVTLGYFRNFEDNLYETSIETFYKRTSDLIEYRNGAELFLNSNLEEDLVQGSGRAYGVEFSLKKTSGDFNGWISYTYSRSLIQVEGATALATINNGDFFPTNFDQPHNFTAFSNWKVTRRFSINSNFTFITGRPISYPESVYQVRGITVTDFAERNNYRIPNYHRLDVSFVLGTTLKRQKKIEANWSLSVYNLYGRPNAYSVYFKNNERTGEPEAFRLSILARPIVAISYNFKF